MWDTVVSSQFPASSKVTDYSMQLSPLANMLVPLENIFKNLHLKMANRQRSGGSKDERAAM